MYRSIIVVVELLVEEEESTDGGESIVLGAGPHADRDGKPAPGELPPARRGDGYNSAR